MIAWHIISLNHEIKAIYSFIKNHPDIYRRYNHIKANIPKKILVRISKEKYYEMENDLLNLLRADYYKNRKFAEKNLNKIKNLWRLNEDSILEYVENITEMSITNKNYKGYIGVLTTFGGYSSENNSINIPSEFKSEKKVLYIISHEFFHLHYWDILKRLKIKNKSWLLSEIVVILALKDFKLWSNLKTDFLPECKKLAKKIIPLWKNRISFEDFIRQSIKIVEKDTKKLSN
jgi:hypothetical protein